MSVLNKKNNWPLEPQLAPLQGKRYYIRTYGCQMNEQDSLQAAGLLRAAGMKGVDTPEAADLILINTCSVREKPVHKVLSDLGRLKELKAANPKLLVGVMGCVAQQEKEALFRRAPLLNLVVGPDHLPNLPALICEHWARLESSSRKVEPLLAARFLKRGDYRFVDLVSQADEARASRSGKQAYVTIMKGCDNLCSFCIVPFVRGREVSRPSEEILQEVEILLAQGVEEITLLGQNVNSYGLKTGERSFTELLYAIAKRAKGSVLRHLRFTTSHPKDIGDDLIRAFGEIETLAPHLHLPVQSGSNRILALMRRAYTREHYLRIARALERARPDILITTDLIVGFPGEGEADFEETLSLLEEARFDGSFSFLYSPRPHTSAGRLPDRVPLAEKKTWLHTLQERQKALSFERNGMWIGREIEVRVEGREKDGRFTGRSAHNKVVHFEGIHGYTESSGPVRVRIESRTSAALYGRVEAKNGERDPCQVD